MEQTLSPRTALAKAQAVQAGRSGLATESVAGQAMPSDMAGRLERLVPLWRHAVWLVALFALLTMWVDVRVDVQQVRKDLDRSGRAHREARIQNDRLQLELDARRRSVVLESAAQQLAASDQAPIVRVATAAAGH